MSQEEKLLTDTTTDAASPEGTSIIRRKSPYARRVQNFLLVWLDASVDEVKTKESTDTIEKFRAVINTVHTFTNVDECKDFIHDVKGEEIFMIVSGEFAQKIIPDIHDMAQVNTIYILCEDRARYEQWAKPWSKVKSVFNNITPTCEALKYASQECDRNLISMSFIPPNSGNSKPTLNQLDQSFMYTQVLKEILLTIDFGQQHINDFTKYCRDLLSGNIQQLAYIDKLEQQYYAHDPIWWYSCACFLYTMLNCALRTMEVDLIVNMGFFVRDLHKHIAELHREQHAGHLHLASFTVYRGQGMYQTAFDQLMETKGGLMSFNNFLSTSSDRAVSFAFAESSLANSDLIGILFEITISPSVPSAYFANIHDVSRFQEEEEFLFSMHSIFRIGEVKQIDGNNRLWQVNLTLTSDHDPELRALTERIREETSPSEKGWYRLVELLITVGHLDKAEQLCKIMLDQKPDNHEESNIYHALGMIKNGQGTHREAIKYYEKSIEIKQKILSLTDPNLAASYTGIGLEYDIIREYQTALSFHQKALEIYEKTHPNHHKLAISYNNIALAYYELNEHSNALSFHEKALEIKEKILPSNDPSLAMSYDNIGLVYIKMRDYAKALSLHENAFEIRQKSLPLNHGDLLVSWNNIGFAHLNIGDYAKALSFFERGLDIGQQNSLPANHPYLLNLRKNAEFARKKL